MEHLIEYFGLFGAAFLSATVFPFQSEVILFSMLMAEHYQVILLVLFASVGNILGSCVNWFRGRCIPHFYHRRRSPRYKERVTKGEAWFRPYGHWSRLRSRRGAL